MNSPLPRSTSDNGVSSLILVPRAISLLDGMAVPGIAVWIPLGWALVWVKIRYILQKKKFRYATTNNDSRLFQCWSLLNYKNNFSFFTVDPYSVGMGVSQTFLELDKIQKNIFLKSKTSAIKSEKNIYQTIHSTCFI